MLDIRFIRENKDIVKEGAKKKHIEMDIDALIALDDTRLELLSKVEALRGEQNKVSLALGAKIEDHVRAQMIKEMTLVKEDLSGKEEELKSVMREWQSLMLKVPNVPDHIELMKNLDMLDTERGTKVAGFRGYFLKGDAVKLQFALWQFVQDFFGAKGDFTPMIVPSLVKKEVFMGTGYIPGGEEDLYKTQDDDYLSGTAEVSTMGYYMGEVLEKKDLPIKMLSFSPAFRREAGSHGKDTRGIIRVHEFYKFEQVVLCEASHVESVKYHEEVQKNTEELTQALGLPYHVVANCGGDLGLGQVKKYDIEVWLPSENTYRETGSASYFHDFQTRRLNIRYRDDDGKMRFVHSLNNTALSGRPLIMIIENYQQADGTIKVPEVLRKYICRDYLGK